MNVGLLVLLGALLVLAVYAVYKNAKKDEESNDTSEPFVPVEVPNKVVLPEPAELPAKSTLTGKTKAELKEFAQDTWSIELDITKTKAQMVDDLVVSHQILVDLYNEVSG